jgi:hypothetical protein
LGLIALFVGIGMVVTVPILLTVGLASGIYGAYQKCKQMDQDDLRILRDQGVLEEERQHRRRVGSIGKDQEQLLDVTRGLGQVARNIDSKMSEIVALEQKREEKSSQRPRLLESIDLRIHISDDRSHALDSPRLFSPGLIRKNHVYSPDSDVNSPTPSRRRASI